MTTTTPPDARNALAEIKAWPLGSYAPGNYCCNCISCKREFTGDKRAIQCLDCAIIAHKARIAALEAQVEGMRVALKIFADEAAIYDPPEGDDHHMAWSNDFPIGALRRARAALQSSETTGEK